MTFRERAMQLYTPYKRSDEYRLAMTRWRGLVRTHDNLLDIMRGKPPKKRKRRGNTSSDSTNAPRADS